MFRSKWFDLVLQGAWLMVVCRRQQIRTVISSRLRMSRCKKVQGRSVRLCRPRVQSSFGHVNVLHANVSFNPSPAISSTDALARSISHKHISAFTDARPSPCP